MEKQQIVLKFKTYLDKKSDCEKNNILGSCQSLFLCLLNLTRWLHRRNTHRSQIIYRSLVSSASPLLLHVTVLTYLSFFPIGVVDQRDSNPRPLVEDNGPLRLLPLGGRLPGGQLCGGQRALEEVGGRCSGFHCRDEASTDPPG